ncbi:MAG TPA: hypothetical protein VFS21_25645 [Roseiflexaceae bacterium]|nr:hypothetical protein [Roseiflexaceae bacterium]
MIRSRCVLVAVAVVLGGTLGVLQELLSPSPPSSTSIADSRLSAAIISMLLVYRIVRAEGKRRRTAALGMLIGGVFGLAWELPAHGPVPLAVLDATFWLLLGGAAFSLGVQGWREPLRQAVGAAIVGGVTGFGLALLMSVPPENWPLWTLTGAGLAALVILFLLGQNAILFGLPARLKRIDRAREQAILAEARRHRELLDRQQAAAQEHARGES